MIDPLNRESPIHNLMRSKIPHKNVNTKGSGSLNRKVRVVRKLYDLSGGAHEKHFILHRILNPTWDIAEEFIAILPEVSATSSNQKIVQRVLIATSTKASHDTKSAADILVKASNKVCQETGNRAASYEQALRSLASLVSDLQKPAEGKKFTKQERMDRVKLIMACARPHLRVKDLVALGFKTSWRTHKRALQLHEEETSLRYPSVKASRKETSKNQIPEIDKGDVHKRRKCIGRYEKTSKKSLRCRLTS